MRARAAAALAPDEFAPAVAVAEALTRLGRVDAALAAFERARSLYPAAAGSGVAAAGTNTDSGADIASRSDSDVTGGADRAWLVPALLLRDLDRTGEAASLLRDGARRGFRSPDVHEQLALLLLADGEVDAALAALSAAASEGLQTPGLDRARGLALARLPDRHAEALALLEAALGDGVGDPLVVRLEAAALLEARGRHPEAIAQLEAARDLAPGAPEVWYRLGRTLAASGDPDAARAALERHRELREARERATDAEQAADDRLGAALTEAGRLAASGDLQGALDLLSGLEEGTAGSRLADLHSLRAKVLFSTGRTEEAARSAAEARRHAPQRVEPHYLEGWFLHASGRAGDAEAALLRALALDSDLGEAHALLGMIAAEAGRGEEAAERMERALQLGLHRNAALRFNYGRVLESLGRAEEAEAQMRAFERLESGPPR